MAPVHSAIRERIGAFFITNEYLHVQGAFAANAFSVGTLSESV
jgi:hypothetical protein